MVPLTFTWPLQPKTSGTENGVGTYVQLPLPSGRSSSAEKVKIPSGLRVSMAGSIARITGEGERDFPKVGGPGGVEKLTLNWPSSCRGF